jgi:hypothetical protein
LRVALACEYELPVVLGRAKQGTTSNDDLGQVAMTTVLLAQILVTSLIVGLGVAELINLGPRLVARLASVMA